MIRIEDTILGPTRGTAEQWKSLLREMPIRNSAEVMRYVDRIYQQAPRFGIDPAILIAQALVETGNFTSAWWVNRLNPAGIGITGDPTQNNASWTWKDGAAAADSQIAHMMLYATGRNTTGFFDPREKDYVDAFGNVAKARTIDDLGGGVWAADPTYAETIVARGNQINPKLGDAPVANVTFGTVPHPDFEDRIIPSSQNSAWDDLGKRTVRAVVWHRMLGSLTGTDGYFRGEGGSRALTDYGCGVLAQDGANLDGVIYRWNDPQGHRSPWANGTVSAPYGDGLAFVNRFGVNGVNRDATAIEISGFQETPLSPKSRASICGITAYWADQAKIPWDTFPAVPGEARSFVIWHQEFTIGTGKECPFATVMNETNALIEQTRGILKKYQTASTTPTPKPPTYADPIIPDWLTADLKDGKPNDHIWTVDIDGKMTRVEVFAAHRPFTATKGANRLQLPFTGAKKVGPRIDVRETFMGRNYAKVGTKTFVQTEYGTWVDNAALTPRISMRRA